jgi:hypothetical protein
MSPVENLNQQFAGLLPGPGDTNPACDRHVTP